jgi:TrpR-related protein YerC/YecD
MRGMNDKTDIKTVELVQNIGSDIDWKTKANKQLIASVLAVNNADEAQRFLRDLMTPLEIKEFASRLVTASLLARDMQYNFITERTGLSSKTIARIAKWLNGSLGGYRLVLARLNNLSLHHSNPKLRKGLSLT